MRWVYALKFFHRGDICVELLHHNYNTDEDDFIKWTDQWTQICRKMLSWMYYQKHFKIKNDDLKRWGVLDYDGRETVNENEYVVK